MIVPFLLDPPADRFALDATLDGGDDFSGPVYHDMVVLNPSDAMAQDYSSYNLGKNSNLCFA